MWYLNNQQNMMFYFEPSEVYRITTEVKTPSETPYTDIGAKIVMILKSGDKFELYNTLDDKEDWSFIGLDLDAGRKCVLFLRSLQAMFEMRDSLDDVEKQLSDITVIAFIKKCVLMTKSQEKTKE